MQANSGKHTALARRMTQTWNAGTDQGPGKNCSGESELQLPHKYQPMALKLQTTPSTPLQVLLPVLCHLQVAIMDCHVRACPGGCLGICRPDPSLLVVWFPTRTCGEPSAICQANTNPAEGHSTLTLGLPDTILCQSNMGSERNQ